MNLSRIKLYKDVLTELEIELLINYLIEKIPKVRKAKDELSELISSGKFTDPHDIKMIRGCIGEYGHDISYYKRLIEKLKNNEVCSPNDAMELWCMCDNKENFDGCHNEMNNRIITKLKEIR